MTVKAPEPRPCNRCGKDKPRTKEHYYSRPDAPDGLQYTCKECCRIRDAKRREERRVEREVFQTDPAALHAAFARFTRTCLQVRSLKPPVQRVQRLRTK